jgi:uncharacterized protein (TIGR02996 family)
MRKQENTVRGAKAAQKDRARSIEKEVSKRHRRTTTATPNAERLRESLEAAVVQNPGDPAAHLAYADFLTEQGDPRGEYIRVQLQLGNASQKTAERSKLQKREQELLAAHSKTWLGELAPYLLRKTRMPGSGFVGAFRFSRGWLSSIRVENYTVAFTRLLASSPQTRLLRRLELGENAHENKGAFDPGDDIPDGCDDPQLYPLLRSPYLGNVRVFVLGEMIAPEDEIEAVDSGFRCRTSGAGAVGLVKLMPKLEELYLLARDVDTAQLFSLKSFHNLRVLQVYHARNYPFARLAKNPSLGKLAHLLFHPHALDPDDEHPYIRLAGVRELVRSKKLPSLTHLRLRLSDMGDAGIKEIVASGILKRLKVLDLRHGRITDDGARMLAGCPDTKRLELLDLANNAITDTGVMALRSAGIRVYAEYQWTPGEQNEWGQERYLYTGDIE